MIAQCDCELVLWILMLILATFGYAINRDMK